jgi:putative NAD(P)H nitroreductase
MRNPIQEIIESRSSISFFDPSRELSDDTINALVEQATRAPSAFNFQNWRFIVVRSPEAKARLKEVAYGQQQVVDASVTFIICGTLAAHEQLRRRLEPMVASGAMSKEMAENWVSQATLDHENNSQLQRDEAIRSASLAGMTLMLAASGMGLANGSMIGFDMAALSREFGLTSNDVPAIVVTVGYSRPGNWSQKPRRPIHELIEVV